MSEIIDIAKLFASGELKFKKGEVDLLNQLVAIVPIDWIVTLQKHLKQVGSENLIYYTAKEMGVRWFENMHKYFKISPEDVIKWGINILGIAGWGETSTPTLNYKEKFYTVKLERGVEAKAFGKTGYAVDHFTRGCYASGAKVLFGGECDAIELSCVSEGAAFCEFIGQPKKSFDRRDPRVIKQLKLPKGI